MKENYKKAKMVNWFEPRVLLQTGLKAVISSLFGNYADRREMQAALDRVVPVSASENKDNYHSDDEIWIDFLSDTGDGFNATFSMAKLVAQEELTVSIDEQLKTLKRGKILVLGGDQVYPSPTADEYNNRFRIPFEAALPEHKAGKTSNENIDHPHMYAIPGNHDWYDGLGNFMKIFCQQRWIGNWETRQIRSYFAVELPHNYWLWATDIQLNEDIDKPQQDYFCNIAKNIMKPDAQVILCTAEPAWVYKQMYPENKSYDRFRFFVEKYITQDSYQLIGKTYELAVVLTGDLHHYSHYCSNTDGNESNHYIGAGGGGAFTHLTHQLPTELNKLDEKGIILKKTFPDIKDSYKLLLLNLIFPFKNYFFSLLIGGIYILFFWLLKSHFADFKGSIYTEHISELSWDKFLIETVELLSISPLLNILSIALIFGFTKFTDTKTGKKGIWLYGLVHGILQVSAIFLSIWFIANLHQAHLKEFIWQLVFIVELFICGSFLGGLLMGLYLYTSNLWFNIHLDEASSSFSNEDYKNFLRLHLTKDRLTIYPIGVKKVTTNWKQKSGKEILFEGDIPSYHLIEKPIIIKNKNYEKAI
jgi:hypothetical protein